MAHGCKIASIKSANCKFLEKLPNKNISFLHYTSLIHDFKMSVGGILVKNYTHTLLIDHNNH